MVNSKWPSVIRCMNPVCHKADTTDLQTMTAAETSRVAIMAKGESGRASQGRPFRATIPAKRDHSNRSRGGGAAISVGKKIRDWRARKQDQIDCFRNLISDRKIHNHPYLRRSRSPRILLFPLASKLRTSIVGRARAHHNSNQKKQRTRRRRSRLAADGSQSQLQGLLGSKIYGS